MSMQLAISLAESGKRVLLIDADLRKSVLMGRTKVSQKGTMGLTHFLAGQCTISDIICTTNIKNFNLIYAGPFPLAKSNCPILGVVIVYVTEDRQGAEITIPDTRVTYMEGTDSDILLEGVRAVDFHQSLSA